MSCATRRTRPISGACVAVTSPISRSPRAPTMTDQVGAAAEAILQLDAVTMRFGGVTALDDISFRIDKGEILGLIGPNGAGKTTCFNVVTGVYQATEGKVLFQGDDLAGRKRYQITKLGIARTFQNIRLFPEMTALENVMVGADAHHRSSVLSAMFGLPVHRREEREGRERAIELLRSVGIADRTSD